MGIRELSKKAIDPNDPVNLNRTLWCVHGHKAHPAIHCLRIKASQNMKGHFVWGYSVWKGEPGFRTLGVSVEKFHENKDLHLYFPEKQDALEYLSIILDPKI